MGMAASQARFLTLTARKSNVEYEGQQVNQERTSLANESSGLFNKMMQLQVPTPPSATDFYNTRYTFDAKGADYAIVENSPRTDGTYDLSISYSANVPTAGTRAGPSRAAGRRWPPPGGWRRGSEENRRCGPGPES